MTPSRSLQPPLFRSIERWNRFAADQATMLFAAGEVVGRRTATMATHGISPNARERRELARMVAEKQSAMLEGSLAAWAEWMRVVQASWLDAVGLAMRNGFALAPLLAMTPMQAMAGVQANAQRAATRSIVSASRQWHAPLDTSLRIADAALGPFRERVAANRKRLAA